MNIKKSIISFLFILSLLAPSFLISCAIIPFTFSSNLPEHWIKFYDVLDKNKSIAQFETEHEKEQEIIRFLEKQELNSFYEKFVTSNTEIDESQLSDKLVIWKVKYLGENKPCSKNCNYIANESKYDYNHYFEFTPYTNIQELTPRIIPVNDQVFNFSNIKDKIKFNEYLEKILSKTKEEVQKLDNIKTNSWAYLNVDLFFKTYEKILMENIKKKFGFETSIYPDALGIKINAKGKTFKHADTENNTNIDKFFSQDQFDNITIETIYKKPGHKSCGWQFEWCITGTHIVK